MFLIVMLAFCFNDNFAQNTNAPTTPVSQDPLTKKDDTDKVYKSTEVDTKVLIKSRPEASSTSDCRADTGTTRIRALLDKSGKVKDVKLIKGLGCGFDDNAIKAAKKIKFTPALKNGVPVSVYVTIEYQYTRY